MGPDAFWNSNEAFVRQQSKNDLFSFPSDLINACMLLSLSRVRLCDRRTVSHQAPLSMGFPRQEYREWVAIFSCRWSSRPRHQTLASCIVGRLSAAELPEKQAFYKRITTKCSPKLSYLAFLPGYLYFFKHSSLWHFFLNYL